MFKNVLTGFIFGMALVFVLFAFSNATFSIQYWNADSRSLCAYVMFWAGIVGGITSALFPNTK